MCRDGAPSTRQRAASRRDREPPVPGRRPAGDGTPGLPGIGAVQTEKFNVFKAMRPLSADDVVRGQFARLPRRVRSSKRFRRRDLLRAPAVHRLVALGGRSLVPAIGEMLGRDRHRGARRAATAAPAALRRLPTHTTVGPTIFDSGSRPTRRSRSRPGSSGPARSSSAISASSRCSTRSQTRNSPTSGSSATRWPATARSSPVRTPSKPRGPSSIPSSKTTIRAHPYPPGSWGPTQADELI